MHAMIGQKHSQCSLLSRSEHSDDLVNHGVSVIISTAGIDTAKWGEMK